ncbi:acetyltransferase [Clostridium botulinum]|uniref:acetyltransferase n=1 Tax=Clostridium botulinum TaxID=1491 RepID=UPI001E3827BC|nr:acetyltransferase [Clostridium botulinum]
MPEENILNENGSINILGYFTLAQKHMQLPQEISKSKRKKYDGINNKATDINCYLIGQLGKNDKYKKVINGKEVLEQAINIIQKCSEYVGGRTILVECENKEPLKKFYTNNNFEYLSTDEVTGLLQYILPLNKTKFVKSDEISNHLQIGC